MYWVKCNIWFRYFLGWCHQILFGPKTSHKKCIPTLFASPVHSKTQKIKKTPRTLFLFVTKWPFFVSILYFIQNMNVDFFFLFSVSPQLFYTRVSEIISKSKEGERKRKGENYTQNHFHVSNIFPKSYSSKFKFEIILKYIHKCIDITTFGV